MAVSMLPMTSQISFASLIPGILFVAGGLAAVWVTVGGTEILLDFLAKGGVLGAANRFR